MIDSTRRDVSPKRALRADFSLSKIYVLLALLLTLAGIFYRFSALDHKFFWHDEVFTSLFLSGYERNVAFNALSDGKPIDRNQAMFFQEMHSDKTLTDTLKSLREHDPHHPPFYYAALWVWARALGDSAWWVRAFSALCGALVLPAFWWLCRELFASSRAAWIGLALIAVSPFQVLYSQEARPYSIWALAICVSCAALLQARRTQNARDWWIYRATIILGLYTHLLFTLVLAAQALWFFLTSRAKTETNREDRVLYIEATNQKSAKWKPFALSLGVAFFAYAPFLLSLLQGRKTAQSHLAWVTDGVGIVEKIGGWTANLSLAFFDPRPELGQLFVLRVLVAAFTVFALVWAMRRAPRSIAIFVVALFFCTLLPFALLDLLFNGKSVLIVRFLVPTILASHLAAVFLVWQLSLMARWRRAALALAILMVCGGLASCEASRRHSEWWIKPGVARVGDAVRLAKNSPRPLFLVDRTDTLFGHFMILARQLPLNARALMLGKNSIAIPNGFSNLYMFSPSPKMQRTLRASGYSTRDLKRNGWNELIPIRPLSSSRAKQKIAAKSSTRNGAN